MGCSLANLGECLPESFMQFILDMFNAPREPLLKLIQHLFTAPVDISALKSLWVVIVSVIGLFYGLAFLWAGLNFILAGFDVSRKETAKTWLKNILMMLVAVQASFWLYQLIVEIGALLTAGVFSMIPAEFFRLTADSVGELGLSMMLSALYSWTLLFTVILLALRYVLVAAGVLFFPIGLFLYFLPPLRSLGQLMLWICGTVIFMTFFASLGLLISSKLVHLEIFDGWKVVLMISAFLLSNAVLFGMLLFSFLKGALSVIDVSFHKTVSTKAIASTVKMIL